MTDPLYIKWAQRTLNRINNAGLKVDGSANDDYRNELARFKNEKKIKEPGLTDKQIGSTCQSEMIRMNHFDFNYANWIRKVLPNAPSQENSYDVLPDAAIRSFQNKEKLKVDGWVGYKTELRLIQISGQEPPVTDGGGGVPAPDKFVIEWNKLTIDQRFGKMAERAADEYFLGAYDPHLKCLAKMLTRIRLDGRPENYFYFTRELIVKLKEASAEPGKEENDPHVDPVLFKHMKKGWYRNRIEMSNEVNNHLMKNYMQETMNFIGGYKWTISSREDYERNYSTFFNDVKNLHKSITDGIGTFAHWWGRVGEKPTLYLARNIMILLSKEKWHIYQCYMDLMPPRYTDGLTFPY